MTGQTIVREFVSPAKAGSVELGCQYPGFRSLRSLYPGLFSAVGFADSLNGFILPAR